MKDDGKRVGAKEAAAFLSKLLDRPITERTLSNWRYARRGPTADYFNGRVSYRIGRLRLFAKEAFRPEPPPVRYRLQRSGEREITAE